MRTLQDATEMICDLKGSVIALDALIGALLHHVPESQRDALASTFEANAEIARTVLLHASISDQTLKGFEADVGRYGTLIRTA
ncbi:MAG: hypothetical protein O9345_00155 [Burkholderiaceae bacterium]|nr:hypothetical protein [Burkholderiales bacterium]MCZ8104664.1 hypothetical protein [Burkholderiales bacterium]MCZ8336572.1 hypothetical protein [Burkholderiaceae bacterium]